MSRTRSSRRSRNEGREIAGPCPVWDMLPPGSGGPESAHAWAGDGYAAAAVVSPQSKSQSSFQTRCMTTASLRATATLARRITIRLASARPHVFSLHVSRCLQ